MGRLAFAVAAALLFVASLAFGVWSYVTDFGGNAPRLGLPAGAAVDAALFTVFALHHSLFARAGLKDWIARRTGPLERSVYVAIASTLFILVCWAWQPLPGSLWRARQPGSTVLVSLQLAGLVITGVASRRLDVFELAGIRQAFGRQQSSRAGLITDGWYALVRHPIYFGWVLMVWPAPHMTATRLVFAAVSTIYLALAIPWEERALVRQFDGEYTAYASRVRWRMIPGVF